MMNQKEHSLIHVHLTQDKVLGKEFQKGQMDVINVHMLGLGKELPEYDEEHKLHRLLGAIFLAEVPKEEKLMIMKQEYNITLEDEIGKDVESMCNLSQYVKEEGIEIGRAQERKRSEKLLAEKDEVIAEKDALIASLRRKLAFYL